MPQLDTREHKGQALPFSSLSTSKHPLRVLGRGVTFFTPQETPIIKRSHNIWQPFWTYTEGGKYLPRSRLTAHATQERKILSAVAGRWLDTFLSKKE